MVLVSTHGRRRLGAALLALGLGACSVDGSGGESATRDAFVVPEVLQGVPSDCPLVLLGRGQIVGALAQADGMQLLVHRCDRYADPALCPTQVVKVNPGNAPHEQAAPTALDLMVASQDRHDQLVGISRIDRRFYRAKVQGGNLPYSVRLPYDPVPADLQPTHIGEDARTIWTVLRGPTPTDYARVEIWQWPLDGGEVRRRELAFELNARVTYLSRATAGGARLVDLNWQEGDAYSSRRYLEQRFLFDEHLEPIEPADSTAWQRLAEQLSASARRPDGLWAFGRLQAGLPVRFRLAPDNTVADNLVMDLPERCSGCDYQTDGFQNNTTYAAAVPLADGSWILGGEATGMNAWDRGVVVRTDEAGNLRWVLRLRHRDNDEDAHVRVTHLLPLDRARMGVILSLSDGFDPSGLAISWLNVDGTCAAP